MAFMTLAGVTVPAMLGDVRETYLDPVAEVERAYDNSPIVEGSNEKRVWEVRAAPMLFADIATLKAAIANMAVVAMDGDIVSNVPVDVRARITEGDVVYDAGGHRKLVRILILED